MGSERYTNIDKPFLYLGRGFSPEGLPILAQPKEVLTTNRRNEARKILLEIQNRVLEGFYCAGWISYEAGELFVKDSSPVEKESETPLVWFGLFDKYSTLSEKDLLDWEKEFEDEAYVAQLRPSIGKEDYRAAFDKIQNFLRKGEVYQVNFTFPVEIGHEGSLGKLFFEVRKKQPVPYEVWIHTGNSGSGLGTDILSFSPELFWERNADRIRTLPMKGTRPRGNNEAENSRLKEELHSSSKDRAENLMIIDLLRNDLGKISIPGSVEVSKLFSIEEYPTVFQMTSEVRSRLLPGTNWITILEALFPGGSITGAPKKRAYEIIADLENERGVYTGGIFFLSPEKDTVSVAIRTLELREFSRGRRIGRMGVGSGITVGSEFADEWDECWSKIKFLKDIIESDSKDYYIFTTMLYKRGCSYFLPHHKERMKRSAAELGFAWSEIGWEKEITDLEKLSENQNPFRVRIRLLKNGNFFTETSPLQKSPKQGKVLVSKLKTDSKNPFLYHKTSVRDFLTIGYEHSSSRKYLDLIYQNEKGLLTEGSIHSLFILLNGEWITPELEQGLLPGVARKKWMDRLKATTGEIRIEDLKLAKKIILVNALRGYRLVTGIDIE